MNLKRRKAILFPLYLLVLALGSYPICDWFRDPFFFLWPRPVQVLYWDHMFHRIKFGDPMPSGIKLYHYHRNRNGNNADSESQPTSLSTCFGR
jgi:hypothetical protein